MRFFLLFCLLMLPACSLIDPAFPAGRGRSGGEWTPREESGTGEPHLWLSAVEYPEGYDWKRDTARGRVPCRIVMFCDGRRRVEIPVEVGGVSAEPDMHRIVAGHLYTDHVTDGGETVIGCDGAECFRYPGRETLRGFLVSGGSIHTLGQDRDGGGLTYRVDGKVHFAREEALIVGSFGPGPGRSGALYRDGKTLCFAFYTREEQRQRCWLWRDGEVQEVVAVPVSARLYDIRSVRGQSVVCYGGDTGLTLSLDGKVKRLPGVKCFRCKILPDEAEAEWGFSLLSHLASRNGGGEYDALLRSSGIERVFEGENASIEYIPLPGGGAMVGLDSAGKVVRIGWMGLTDESEGLAGRLLMGPHCMYFTDTEAWLALTGDGGGEQNGVSAALWHRGELTTVLLSGYLTGIAYE